jgi:hypothetical protein
MAESNVTLDHKGIAQLLKSAPFKALVDETAHQLADAARETVTDGAVIVHEYTTDRAAASVSVPAPYQANHGALTRAATALGLEMRPRK